MRPAACSTTHLASPPPACLPACLPQVIKLISQVIADFADGEISQAASLFDTSIDLPRYLDKSFWKTASLIAASCRSAAVFSDCSEEGESAGGGAGRGGARRVLRLAGGVARPCGGGVFRPLNCTTAVCLPRRRAHVPALTPPSLPPSLPLESPLSPAVKEAMYAYGKHLGLAFQVVDDILDFTQVSALYLT